MSTTELQSRLRSQLAITDKLGGQVKISPADARVVLHLLEVLSDPQGVHINMLRGSIATPHVRSMLHLLGEQALARWERGKADGDPADW